MSRKPIYVSGAVEGDVDAIVLRRLLEYSGLSPATIYGRKGKMWIKKRIDGYNQAAQLSHWLVLIDLDHDADCAPALIKEWIPRPSPYMVFRVAVRAIEAWLLADRKRFAQFFCVPEHTISLAPETLPDPKQEVVNLARRSSSAAIRKDIVPRKGSGRKTGPVYTSRLIEFISYTRLCWRPDAAARHAESLQGCLQHLKQLKDRKDKGITLCVL